MNDKFNDKFTFGLDMKNRKHRKILRDFLKGFCNSVMENGEYLTEVEIDKDIFEVRDYDITLAHIIKSANITFKFDYREKKDGN